MSAKITGSSSTFCFNNGRSCTKINGLDNLQTIRRLKKIDHPRLFLHLNSDYGISRVISQTQDYSSSSSSSPSPSSSSWPKKWLWGFLLTVILPAAGHKGGLLRLILFPTYVQCFNLFWDIYIILGNGAGKIDEAIETVAEEIAEEIVEEKLPGDSKIKEALEDLAVKEARKAEDIIHKVKDMEEEIEEALMGAAKDQEKK